MKPWKRDLAYIREVGPDEPRFDAAVQRVWDRCEELEADAMAWDKATRNLANDLSCAREALEFYAQWRNYRWPVPDDRNHDHVEGDCAIFANDSWLGGQPGSRARAALGREAL